MTRNNEEVKCGYCGKTYDAGEKVGNLFQFFPEGGRAYNKHARAEHYPEKDSEEVRLACGGECRWICSACGAERVYRSHGPRHNGPSVRLLDPRYGLAHCGSYPTHKRVYGKVDGKSGPVIWYHEGAPNPEQPEQTDPTLRRFIPDEKSAKKSTPKRQPSNKRSPKAEPGTRNTRPKGGVLVTRRRTVG